MTVFTGPSLALSAGILNRSARVAVIGLGYVGLPLAMAIAKAGFPVVGFDIDAAKTEALNAGTSYIDAVRCDTLKGHLAAGKFVATSDKTVL